MFIYYFGQKFYQVKNWQVLMNESVYEEKNLVEIDDYSDGKEEAILPFDHKSNSELEVYKHR